MEEEIRGLILESPQPTPEKNQRRQELVELTNTLKQSSKPTLSSQSIITGDRESEDDTASGPTLPIFSGIDSLPTPGPDEIRGNEEGNLIPGLQGDDLIYGNGGNDLIDGGGGADKLRGHEGNDEIFGDYEPSGDASLVASGNDTLWGHDGNDDLYGQGGTDNLYGGKGNDIVDGGVDNDNVFGGDGNDLLFGDNIFLAPQDQAISDTAASDRLHGGYGHDVLVSGFGNDVLEGNVGRDTLFGGTQSDTLLGGTNHDHLIGASTVFFGRFNLGFGTGEIDVLNGNGGNDTFYLGLDVVGTNQDRVQGQIEDVVFYDDGNVDNIGDRDYGLIKDFGFAGDSVGLGIDKIALPGSAEDYSLGSFSNEDVSGTGIFLEKGQNTPELIGVLENISLNSVNLANSSQFIYDYEIPTF